MKLINRLSASIHRLMLLIKYNYEPKSALSSNNAINTTSITSFIILRAFSRLPPATKQKEQPRREQHHPTNLLKTKTKTVTERATPDSNDKCRPDELCERAGEINTNTDRLNAPTNGSSKALATCNKSQTCC